MNMTAGPQFEGREEEFDLDSEAERAKKRKKKFAFLDDNAFRFDYKDTNVLKHFITDRGKIVPRRISGLSSKQQRDLTTALKRARMLALIPYTSTDH